VDSEEEKAALCARFKTAVQKIGGPAAFIRGYGKAAASTVHTWLAGTTAPDIGALIYLSNQHGFSADWLLHGNGPTMTAEAKAEHDSKLAANGSSAVGVPFYEYLRPAAGGGSEVLEETARVVFFDESWLRRSFGVEPRDVIMVTSIGDSMEPLIHAADPLLVNISEHGKQLGEGVFFIRHEGVIKVKRLQPRPGHILRIASDNPAYQADEISMNDEGIDLAIIGRVLCICKRL
jgi:phage repressor protein C with HTH and peptisase S24 domain